MPTLPPTFRSRQQQSRQEQNRDYDARRGSASQRGYDGRWQKAIATWKARSENCLCIGCKAVGYIAATEIVDHVEPHRGDQLKFWDKGNWQPCCRWHHDVVKQILERDWDAGRIGLADLRLDSAYAIRITNRMRGGG